MKSTTEFEIETHLLPISSQWIRTIIPTDVIDKKAEIDKKMLDKAINWFDTIYKCDKLDNLKNKFNKVGDKRLFQLARDISNPYENIGKLKYQNRSAVKLLEIDQLLEGRLVKCRRDQKEFKFIDLCGGPGGFSEYIFSMLPDVKCSGIGVTLKAFEKTSKTTLKSEEVFEKTSKTTLKHEAFEKDAKNQHITPENLDWNLDKLKKNPLHNFECYYGTSKDNGDVTKSSVLLGLVQLLATRAEVDKSSDVLVAFPKSDVAKSDIDLIVADGAFSIEGNEEHQEFLHLKLFLAEFIIAILCCKKSATSHFVCKIFDSRFLLTNYLILLTSVFFESFMFIKPCQSRPANSEKYIIFRGRKTIENEDKYLNWLLALYLMMEKINMFTISKDDLSSIINKIPISIPLDSFMHYEEFVEIQKRCEDVQLECVTSMHKVLHTIDRISLSKFAIKDIVGNTMFILPDGRKIKSSELCSLKISELQSFL